MTASNRNYELKILFVEFTVILSKYLKFFERRKYFFSLKIFILPPIGLCRPGRSLHSPLPATAIRSLAGCIFRCIANDGDWETGRTGSYIVTVVSDVVSITGYVAYEFFGWRFK